MGRTVAKLAASIAIGFLIVAPTTRSASRAAGSVVVSQSGWSQVFQGHFSSYCSYGLVLRNRAQSMDAMGVTVRAKFINVKGAVLDSESTRLTGVPADSTFVVGGDCETSAARVARMLTTVSVTSTQAKHLVLPMVSGAHIDHLLATSVFTVVGTLINPYRKAINTNDPIGYAVVYSRSGKIVGGESDPPFDVLNYPRQSVPPGASAPLIFEPDPGIPNKLAAYARISVDPRYIPGA